MGFEGELLKFTRAVELECSRAEDIHAPINSLHEGYAVILEELDEFWEQVRLKAEQRSPEAVLQELVQVAAMAARTAVNCGVVKEVTCMDTGVGDGGA